MLLTAGMAAGLTLFAPRRDAESMRDPEYWIVLGGAVLIGLSLLAPLFCLGGPGRNERAGVGRLFALATGLGVLLLLPAAVVERLARLAEPASIRNLSGGCLYYVIPTMALWCLLAAILTGEARRVFHRGMPWTERYGLALALLWSPLGAWHLVGIYRDVW